MKTLSDIGRIIFAVVFIVFGAYNIIYAKEMTVQIPPFLPGPVYWVYGVAIAEILAAFSIILKKKAQLSCILLAVMLLGFVLMVHVPSLNSNKMAVVSILKDLGLMGAALSYASTIK